MSCGERKTAAAAQRVRSGPGELPPRAAAPCAALRPLRHAPAPPVGRRSRWMAEGSGGGAARRGQTQRRLLHTGHHAGAGAEQPLPPKRRSPPVPCAPCRHPACSLPCNACPLKKHAVKKGTLARLSHLVVHPLGRVGVLAGGVARRVVGAQAPAPFRHGASNSGDCSRTHAHDALSWPLARQEHATCKRWDRLPSVWPPRACIAGLTCAAPRGARPALPNGLPNGPTRISSPQSQPPT